MNPFSDRLQRARNNLDRLNRLYKKLDNDLLPGSWVTGRSGTSASYHKKLDRQILKTTELASKIVAARKKVEMLERQAAAFEKGLIDIQGRHISPKQEKRKRRPRKPSVNKQLRERVMLALDIDGKFTLPHGDTISVLVGWDETEREPAAIVRVIDSDGNKTDHRAKSVQGVHIKQTVSSVLDGLLGKAS